VPDGFKIDLIEESRFEGSWPPSVIVIASLSVAENDLFLDGDRKDAGDRDVCLSEVAASDVSGASLLSSLSESGTICEWVVCEVWYAARSPGRSGDAFRFVLSGGLGRMAICRCSCRLLMPKFTDPSAFIVPLSGVPSDTVPGVSIDSIGPPTSSSSGEPCEAGMIRFRLLITDFFIVTGRCTPWSL
jgi:hypothetical protein